jgi:DNA-binding NarL/FixJ family response regulator
MKKTILIIDDHQIFLKGLESAIGFSFEAPIIYTCLGFGKAVDFMTTHVNISIDLILLDGRLGDGNYGWKLIPDLKKVFPNAKIISMSSENALNKKALEMGADDFCLKECVIQKLESMLLVK